jgi:hypothetical protein
MTPASVLRSRVTEGQETSNCPIEGSPSSRQISRHEHHGFPLLRRAWESDGGSVPRARDRDGSVIPRGVQLCSGRRFAGALTAGSCGVADLAAVSIPSRRPFAALATYEDHVTSRNRPVPFGGHPTGIALGTGRLTWGNGRLHVRVGGSQRVRRGRHHGELRRAA